MASPDRRFDFWETAKTHPSFLNSERNSHRTDGQSALERLWALNACGGLTDDAAIKLLSHNDPFVRAWTVRLVCDPKYRVCQRRGCDCQRGQQ